MEFLSFDPANRTLSLKRTNIPRPGPDEVLIKVAYSGICGTDLHILEGSFPCKNVPFTLGHEFCGVVQAIGSSVTTFKIGQRVTVDPNSGCNICTTCHQGRYHLCESGGINNTIGIFRDGGWATHAVIPERQVHLVPDGIEMPQAALSEPLSCLAHGWDRLEPVDVGARVLVVGAGIIGLLWSCVLHLRGLRKTVTISEPQQRRRCMAADLGLDYETKSPEDIRNKEFDLVVDCSGSGPAMESAISLMARGGRFCVFGVADPKTRITVKPFEVYAKELSIVGVNINPFTFPKGLALVEAMADSYLRYEKLGIKVFKLSEYESALKALKNCEISKVEQYAGFLPYFDVLLSSLSLWQLEKEQTITLPLFGLALKGIADVAAPMVE